MKLKLRGFTFLELMIALSFFLIAVMSVLQIFPVNRRLLRATSQTTQAAFLAQEQLELIRSVPYANLTTGTYLTRAAVSSVSTNPASQFEREILVSFVASNRSVSVTDVGLKKVVVNIYWKDEQVARQYTITTYAFSSSSTYSNPSNAAPNATAATTAI